MKFRGLFWVCLFVLSGCGTESGLLQSQNGILLTARDLLVLPRRPARLQARVQTGDFLTGQRDLPVRFYQDGTLFKTTLTNDDGIATVTFTPDQQGDYHFTAELTGFGYAEPTPPPCDIFVACRSSNAPMLIVDMDKTIVASGFQTVLLADPVPAEGSQKVLHQLANSYTIIYLTHRPEYFGPKSKAWLKRNHFPQGPVILSSLSGFLKGSQAFKSAVLKDLRSRFSRIEIGIGDKISDALAYHENHIHAFVILLDLEHQNDQVLNDLLTQLRSLPDSVQVAADWSQIDAAINRSTPCPPSQTIALIESILQSRSSRQGAQP